MEYLARAVVILCYFFIGAIAIRSLLSWFTVDPRSSWVNLLHTITEPILRPLRRILPRLEMFDFSPMVAIMLLFVIVIILEQYAL